MLSLVYVLRMRLALLALSASFCICAMLAHASCYSVCASTCAVHERLGASCPVCSIAFALCLCVQHVPLLAVEICVYATHAAWPFLPCLHPIAFELCLLVQLALLFVLVYLPCMCGLAPLALSAALHGRYACGCSMCHCSH